MFNAFNKEYTSIISVFDPKDEHTFDPEGDVLLVLKNPDAPFAVWPAEESVPPDAAQEGNEKNSSTDAVQEGNGENSSTDAAQEDNANEENSSTIPESPARVVKFHLSSKHLDLGSKYFHKMFNGPWKEKAGSHSDPLQLTAEDWNEQALFIVMSALHGYADKVPRSVSLELLANIAVIVDYYQCQRVFSFFIDVWLSKLETERFDLPKKLDRDAILWLHIGWVFKKDVHFSNGIFPIQKNARCPVPSLGLPIPERVFEKIEETRVAYASSTMDVLQGKIDLLIKGDSPCTANCSSMLLGALLRYLTAHGLYPLPKAPYRGLSINGLDSVLDSFPQSEWAFLAAYCESKIDVFETAFRKGLAVGPGSGRFEDPARTTRALETAKADFMRREKKPCKNAPLLKDIRPPQPIRFTFFTTELQDTIKFQDKALPKFQWWERPNKKEK